MDTSTVLAGIPDGLCDHLFCKFGIAIGERGDTQFIVLTDRIIGDLELDEAVTAYYRGFRCGVKPCPNLSFAVAFPSGQRLLVRLSNLTNNPGQRRQIIGQVDQIK